MASPLKPFVIPCAPSDDECANGGRLIHFNARSDAERGFICDMLEMNPLDFQINATDLQPKLTIVQAGKETRRFGEQSRPAAVCKMVPMDGNMCLVNAATNSGTDDFFHKTKVAPGSTITIKQFAVLWHEATGLCERKATVLLEDFEISRPPVASCLELDWETPHWKELWVHRVPVDKVHRKSLITHLEPVQLESMQTVWKMADSNMIHRTGSFIQDEATRRECVRALRKRIRDGCDPTDDGSNKENGPCECIARFNLKECCLVTKPFESVDQDFLHEDACDKLDGDVSGDCFDNLTKRHKRWCYNHFCFVNCIHSTYTCGHRSSRVDLPSCLAKKDRSVFPPTKEEPAVGFKPKNGSVKAKKTVTI